MTKRNRPSGQKLTADTITDEQIRELVGVAMVAGEYGLIWVCDDALLDEAHTIHEHVKRKRARARCAEILNARKEVPNAD